MNHEYQAVVCAFVLLIFLSYSSNFLQRIRNVLLLWVALQITRMLLCVSEVLDGILFSGEEDRILQKTSVYLLQIKMLLREEIRSLKQW